MIDQVRIGVGAGTINKLVAGAGIAFQRDGDLLTLASTVTGGGGGAPAPHASTHQAGGSDAIRLDDLAAAEDNTDLNATTSMHGLLPKLSGSAGDVLKGDGTWGTGGSGAPTDATYIVQTAHAGLSAEQALASLATGVVKVTTGTGVLSTAVANTDYAAASHVTRHQDGGADELSVAGLSGLLADGQTPLAHATAHKAGGSDAIKLDELAAPTDVTTLNASASAHGLMQKYPGGTTTFLRADGAFAAPTATAGDLDQPEVGALTIATAKYHLTAVRHTATGSQRITVAGTGRWRLMN